MTLTLAELSPHSDESDIEVIPTYGERYRIDNKGKILARAKQYYIDHKEKILEYQKERRDGNKERAKRYNSDNKERIAEQRRQYRKDNREKVAEQKKQHYMKNREKIIAKEKQYRLDNKEAITAHRISYVKKKIKLNDNYRSSINERKYVSFIIRPNILKRDNYRCCMCGSNKKLKIHHILPVKDAPDRVLDEGNLITLCHECHIKAHDGNYKRYDPVWAEIALERNRNIAA